MSRMLHNMPSTLVTMLAVVAIVAVLIPTWSMAMCSMDMDIASMLLCDSIWLTSDAETGTLVTVFVFALLMLAVTPVMAQTITHSALQPVVADSPEPHPPDDPLMGRLTL